MALMTILLVVFVGVGLMVFFGERYGTPMEPEQQAKFAKITRILVFVLLIVAIINAMV